MRAHRAHFQGDKLGPGVFRAQGGALSVDWQRYSSPEETKQRAKKPDENAVIVIPVGGIREVKPLRLEHTPIYPLNRAHSEVFDLPEREQLAEARVKLLRVAEIVIPLPPTYNV